MSLAVNQLAEFARSDPPSWTEITGYNKESFSKEGKTIENKEPIQETNIERWGLWTSFDSYNDGSSAYYGSLGVDYRLAPHWLLGADMRLGYVSRNSGLGLAQGGLYTAWYEKNWWGVAGTYLGPNQYTLYACTGYDFQKGPWLFGPVAIVQFDADTVDEGFGRGDLFQTRIGGRVAYAGRLSPWLVVTYQNQTIDEIHNRQNGVWMGAGVSYEITDHWELFGGYSFEGSSRYQINQADLGLRWSF